MRFTFFLALASLSAAYVVPSEEILEAFTKDSHQKDQGHTIHNKDQRTRIQNPLDDALDTITRWPAHDLFPGGFDTAWWINQLKNYALDRLHDDTDSEDGRNEEYRIAKEGELRDQSDIDVNGKLPFPIPHLPIPSHHPPTKTIYQLLNSSEHTTRLAEIINEDKTLIQLLNNTDASQKNLTLFAPSDRAFDKLPKQLPKPSKEAIRAAIKYHIADGAYSVLDVLHQRTLPTLLKEQVSGYDLPQRVAVRAGLTGLKVNFYSRITATNIGATNGLIHSIDSILIPPPPALSIFNLVPTKFSTLTLALLKTGLAPTLENADKRTTIFAPSNTAFDNLGLKANAFLFSAHGTKYLRALLQYHIVQNRTLFSDVFYTYDGHVRDLGRTGFTHLDLPTLLGHHSNSNSNSNDNDNDNDNRAPATVAVDVARFGAVTSIKLNNGQRVAFMDALARDGVVHILDHVLIPPPPPSKDTSARAGDFDFDVDESDLTVEDLKARLGPWVLHDAVDAVPDRGEL